MQRKTLAALAVAAAVAAASVTGCSSHGDTAQSHTTHGLTSQSVWVYPVLHTLASVQADGGWVAPPGVPVYAVHDGTIAVARDGEVSETLRDTEVLDGQQIRLTGVAPFTGLAPGQPVKAGQTIGQIAQSGRLHMYLVAQDRTQYPTPGGSGAYPPMILFLADRGATDRAPGQGES